MKVAIAVWEDCVSSVLDFAQRLVVAELKDGTETSRTEIALPERNVFTKLAKLRELGIDVIICGAVSQPLASAFPACGIQLLPYVRGRVDEVLNAYQAGQLGLPQFTLPGRWPGARRGFRCRCRGHERHRRAGRPTGDLTMRRRDIADGDAV
jgi:predicted Fe-Mo cluster-binding NifX family protein